MRTWNRGLSILSFSLLTLFAAGCGGGSSTDPSPPPTTYTISGTVTGSTGVTLTLGGAASNTATSAADGTYAFTGLANGSYTVTPSKAGFTFTPASRSVTVAGASVTAQSFVAAANTSLVSGTVSGAAAVTVTLGGGATPQVTTTDGAGAYSFTVTNGAYTVVPSKAGFAFAPLSTVVNVSGANVANVNFIASAAATTYTLSGSVSGAIQDGVTVSIARGVDTIGTVSTSGGGGYSFAGLVDGGYLLTPSKPGYTFSPTTITATVAGANLTAQNFSATAITYTVSGTITGATSVSVALSGVATSSTTTDGAGHYAFAGLVGGSYTVTPSKTGHTFAPANRGVTVAGADLTGQDFVATPTAGYTISGTLSGPWIKGVKVTLGGALSANTTTDELGAYSFTGLVNDTFTVTPSLDGYSYAPAAPSVTLGGANKAQDFTATSTIPSYSISGTVSYAGAKTGRVHLWVSSNGCTNCSAQAVVSIAGPGAYTIRGLQNGTYSVSARRDSQGQGVVNASDPTGSVAGSVTIAGAHATGANIALTDPPVPSPANLGPPGVLAGDHGAVVFFSTDMDANSREKATSYDLSWGTDAAATNGAGSPVRLVARGDGVYFQSGLNNETTSYYKVRSNVGATSGTYSSVASATVGPVAGGFTVSGTVTFPVGATGPLYVAIGDGNTGNMKVAAYPLPLTSPAAFSVTGVPAGTWGVYAILDQNGNGVIDVGDLSNTNGVDSKMITVGATMSGVGVTLSGAKSAVSTTTEHALNDSGTVHSYGLQTTVSAKVQRVVRAMLVAGKGVAVPADLGGDRELYRWWGLGTTAPGVGDVYTYEVTYGDGSSELLTAPVTTLLSSFAQGLTATTTGGGSVAQPLFSWSAPASPPPSYGYSLSVWGNANWYWPRDARMSPSSVTSVRYNADGRASPPDLTTGTYTWSVAVFDASGNSARQEKTYTVP
jgi:uncharacterized protein (DUF2141 family)